MHRHILLIAAVATASPAFAGAGAAAPYVASPYAADYERSLTCLTQAVYYEARNQPVDGQRAVAQVVLNRVRHPSYPNSVCGVVFQGSERVTGCQFSFTCDGSMYRRIEPHAWARAEAIAQAALAGDVFRPVGLALNFHTVSISPYWAPSLVRQAVVGSHVFYRRPGTSAEDFVQRLSEESHGVRIHRARHEMPVEGMRVDEVPVSEIAVPEIPIERPARFQTVAAGGIAASAPAPSQRSAAPGSGPRVTVESGVRVVRGR